MSTVLQFEGSSFFRQRIICSVLSAKPIKITKIREGEKTPGLADYEISLLRLIDKITNGNKVEIDFLGMSSLCSAVRLTGRHESVFQSGHAGGWQGEARLSELASHRLLSGSLGAVGAV
jgi:RNA 3'-terminal phosphate cyclase-like protein